MFSKEDDIEKAYFGVPHPSADQLIGNVSRQHLFIGAMSIGVSVASSETERPVTATNVFNDIVATYAQMNIMNKLRTDVRHSVKRALAVTRFITSQQNSNLFKTLSEVTIEPCLEGKDFSRRTLLTFDVISQGGAIVAPFPHEIGGPQLKKGVPSWATITSIPNGSDDVGEYGSDSLDDTNTATIATPFGPSGTTLHIQGEDLMTYLGEENEFRIPDHTAFSVVPKD